MWNIAKKTFLKNMSFLMLVMVTISAFTKLSSSQRGAVTAGAEDGYTKAEAMNIRTQRMRQACSQYPVRRQVTTRLGGTRLFYISEQHKLSYCRIAKVGSTFWTQAFMTMAGIKPDPEKSKGSDSMFNMPRDEAHNSMKSHHDLQMEFNDPRIHNTTSFMVARSPYSRLFSSYIDQIFLPNKWDHAAKMVKHDPKREKCGSDVTFDEFLSSISDAVLQKQTVDLHWAPIFSICLPCASKFDILAKQETFNDDAQYILDLVGVDKSIRDDVARATESALFETAIPTLVHTYVTKGNHVKSGCISQLNLAKKIWTAFQIQGYIHDEIQFPEDKFTNADKVNEELLSTEVLRAVAARRLSSEERRSQRHCLMVRYWKSVSLQTLRKVQDAYYEDFYVFQYDIDPNTM